MGQTTKADDERGESGAGRRERGDRGEGREQSERGGEKGGSGGCIDRRGFPLSMFCVSSSLASVLVCSFVTTFVRPLFVWFRFPFAFRFGVEFGFGRFFNTHGEETRVSFYKPFSGESKDSRQVESSKEREGEQGGREREERRVA